MDIIAAVFASGQAAGKEFVYPVEDFYFGGFSASERFASITYADVSDTAKWPEVHTAFAKQNGLKYPVNDTAYNRLAPSALRAVWPHIAALPAREFDIVTMFDKLYCVPSGSGRNKSGQKLYINFSQAANRDPVTFGHLSCITPGGKYIDLEAGEIMHGAVLMKLQCITDSYDITFQFGDYPEKLLSDMAGNACCGLSFGKALVSAFVVSATVPRHRVSRLPRRISFDEAQWQEAAKRFKPDSGLGALLALGSGA